MCWCGVSALSVSRHHLSSSSLEDCPAETILPIAMTFEVVVRHKCAAAAKQSMQSILFLYTTLYVCSIGWQLGMKSFFR